ncbi:hypothetical protein [Chryseobacterium sp. MMS23-Vi53]|uniref:hypothetical protein n=1 Tax=Chryseobacterium sp. MMS23-Vi53 TaxID=3386644 RepID=UPI0039E7A9F3
MKKKIFRYKFVYWIGILLSLIVMTSFGLAGFNRIITNSFNDFQEVLFSITTFSIFILSVISLILLILKNKNSVLVLSSLLVSIIITLSLGILNSIFIMKDFGINKSDYLIAFCIYLILFGFLYLIQRFKYKDLKYESIELIGTHND